MSNEVISNDVMVRMAQLSDAHKITFHFARITGGDEQQFDCVVRDAVDQVVARGTGSDRDGAAESAIKQIEGNQSMINRTTVDLAREVALLREQLSKARPTATKQPTSP